MKDPFFKPILFGGLLIALLSIFFALGIFIWAFIGGWFALKYSHKAINKVINFFDSIIIGLCTGIFGSILIDLLTVISFSSPENRKSLITLLKKNWPSNEILPPDLSKMLPDILLLTSFFIIIVCVVFSIIGAVVSKLTLDKKKS